ELPNELGVLGVDLDPKARVDRLTVPIGSRHNRHRAVSEGGTARREAALETPAEPAVRVGRNLGEGFLVHDAHHPSANVAEIEPGRSLERLATMQLEPVANPAGFFAVPREPRREARQQLPPPI